MVDDMIKKLLEAGVHFGHQTERWNPKMKPYIFGHRNGIYIIDLEKTAECLNKARDIIRDIATQGGRVLFVGTKKQAQPIVEEESKRCEMFFMNNRWPGGLLTNFQTVKKSINRLKKIEEMSKEGVWENLTKKEVSNLTKERQKLLLDLGGIRDMDDLPQAVFVIDPKRENIAITESTKLRIPIIAICDTNCNPDPIDYPVPGNDDALKSIRVITSLIADSILEGRKEFMVNEKIRKAADEKQRASVAAEKNAPAAAQASGAA